MINKNEWIYIPSPGRMDAFNFETTKSELETLVSQAHHVALDVSTAPFISIPMIKLIHALAGDLLRKGGRLALVGPTEKLKRQFRIFASLDPFVLYSQDSWSKLVNTNLEGNV